MPAPLILPHYDFVTPPGWLHDVHDLDLAFQITIYSHFAHAPNQVTKHRSGYKTFILVLHSKTVRNVL